MSCLPTLPRGAIGSLNPPIKEGTMERKCNKCKAKKDVSEFYLKEPSRRARYSSTDNCFYTSHCKECIKTKQIAYRKNNPEKGKDVDLFQKFGIRFEDYKKMYDAQKGCCAICERHSDKFHRSLNVDHDHVSGKIRGLLCTPCNTVLGRMEENVKWFHNCLSYLEQHQPELADKSNVIAVQLKKVG